MSCSELEQQSETVERKERHGSMQPCEAWPSHGRESSLWTSSLPPQGSDVRVSRPSTGIGGRVLRSDSHSAPNDRDEPITAALASLNDPHWSTHESMRRCGSVGRLGEGSISIGNGLPNRDRLRPAEACLLTTRIRILLLPMVQAAVRCACGADEPGTRNQPKMSSTHLLIESPRIRGEDDQVCA